MTAWAAFCWTIFRWPQRRGRVEALRKLSLAVAAGHARWLTERRFLTRAARLRLRCWGVYSAATELSVRSWSKTDIKALDRFRRLRAPLNPSNLGEMPHARSIPCDPLATWRTLFWWVESGSENCHSKRLESLGNQEGRPRDRRNDRSAGVHCQSSQAQGTSAYRGAFAVPHYDIGLTIDLDRWHDTRRGVEPAWRSWCKSPTWKSIRRHRLAEEPRCRQCAIEGRIVGASHVDHIEPHLGQWLLFFKYENTQSLCAHHHHRHNHPEKRSNSNKPTDRLVGARAAIRS